MKRKRNSNFMKVRVKNDRCCCHCGSLIHKGTECLTLNRYGSGCVWSAIL